MPNKRKSIHVEGVQHGAPIPAGTGSACDGSVVGPEDGSIPGNAGQAPLRPEGEGPHSQCRRRIILSFKQPSYLVTKDYYCNEILPRTLWLHSF